MAARRAVLESDLVARGVAEWLCVRDLMRVCQTSTGTRRELRAHLEKLDLRFHRNVKDKDVATIVRCFPHLRSLRFLDGCYLTPAVLRAISRLANLRELDIPSRAITDENYVELSASLESLTIHFSREVADTSVVAIVRRCSWLRELDLSCAKLSDAAIVEVAGSCPRLQKLNLCFVKDITNVGLVEVSRRCPDLKWLSIEGNKHITDEAIASIAMNCSLEYLEGNNHITDASIIVLAENCSTSLKTLVVARYRDSGRVTDASVTVLARCKLESLSLEGCSVTDVSIELLVAGCGASLLDLDLNNCNLSDASAKAISQCCPKLNSLILGGGSFGRRAYTGVVSDVAIIALASGCPCLRTLRIDSTWITDVSCNALARGCPDLRDLTLFGSKITDDGLMALARGCRLLHSLDMGAELISDAGVDALSGLYSFYIRDNDIVTVDSLIHLARRSPYMEFMGVYGCAVKNVRQEFLAYDKGFLQT
eukprot:CAMPEP_0119286858 /NCGR_PEP_ID=MMETSP1329-20130426/34588_1 /TAXON_ID=114041 /ORGANISM="Genus nov. species nov., Strain RCC1024" /LENGTH=480 /DNA_ID=CAMNT_0007287603 /DNA_START=42 /DNA_END=1481 /DNA_ORIENTATION=-